MVCALCVHRCLRRYLRSCEVRHEERWLSGRGVRGEGGFEIALRALPPVAKMRAESGRGLYHGRDGALGVIYGANEWRAWEAFGRVVGRGAGILGIG